MNLRRSLSDKNSWDPAVQEKAGDQYAVSSGAGGGFAGGSRFVSVVRLI